MNSDCHGISRRTALLRHKIDFRFRFACSTFAMDEQRKDGALVIAACAVTSIPGRADPAIFEAYCCCIFGAVGKAGLQQFQRFN
jgi:hypothetical protein